MLALSDPIVDRFMYTAHAPRNMLLKNAGVAGICAHVLVLLGLSAALIGGCITLFKRKL